MIFFVYQEKNVRMSFTMKQKEKNYIYPFQRKIDGNILYILFRNLWYIAHYKKKSEDDKRGKYSTSELVDYNTEVFYNVRD